MSYRDPVEAARARRDALDATLSRLDEDDPRRTALESELASVHETIEASRTKLALSVLSNVRIATPCPASWAAMAGDDRVRHCALCEKNVYDLAGLTAWESVQLLAANGEMACVRLHRRRDGTVITANCEVGRRRRRKRGAIAAAGALAIASAGVAARPSPAPAESPMRFERSPRYQFDPHAAFYRSPPPAPAPVVQGMIGNVGMPERGFDEDAFLYGPPPVVYPEEEVCGPCEPASVDERDAADSMHDRSDRSARSRGADGEAP